MSNNVILDASALLALLKDAPGADIIEPLLGRITMSSINVSEVAESLLNSEMTLQECQEAILPFISTIVPFDEEQAFLAAELKKQTNDYNLSPEDRACLALGQKIEASYLYG
jgi:ribonuclease VapC